MRERSLYLPFICASLQRIDFCVAFINLLQTWEPFIYLLTYKQALPDMGDASDLVVRFLNAPLAGQVAGGSLPRAI